MAAPAPPGQPWYVPLIPVILGIAFPAAGAGGAAGGGIGFAFKYALTASALVSVFATVPTVIKRVAQAAGYVGAGAGALAGERVAVHEVRRVGRLLGGNLRNAAYAAGGVARNAGVKAAGNFRNLYRAAGGDARVFFKVAGKDIHGAALTLIQLISYAVSKPIEYIISQMPNFSPEERIAVSKFISEVYSNSGRSFYVFIVLITVALANMVTRGEFGVKSNSAFFKLVEMVLDAAHNVGQKGFAGVYKLVQVFAQLVGFVWENGGRPALTRALRYASGYYKLLDKPAKINDTQPILQALQKAENKTTAVLQNKANKAAVQTNSPKIAANSIAELEIKAEIAGATAKHKKQMEAFKSKTPSANNAAAMLKHKKLQFKKEQAHKAHIEELKKKLEALKTPHVKLPSPPTAQQVAKINKSINTVAKNSPSPNNNSPSPNKTPSPKKKTPSPKMKTPSSAQLHSAISSVIKKQKKGLKKVTWKNMF